MAVFAIGCVRIGLHRGWHVSKYFLVLVYHDETGPVDGAVIATILARLFRTQQQVAIIGPIDERGVAKWTQQHRAVFAGSLEARRSARRIIQSLPRNPFTSGITPDCPITGNDTDRPLVPKAPDDSSGGKVAAEIRDHVTL